MAKKLLKKKPLKAKSNSSTQDRIESLVKELTIIKDNKKLIEAREKELANELKELLPLVAQKDNKGSYKLVVGDKVAQKQARKSVSLNKKKAEEFFTELGLWEQVTDVTRVINENYVEQALLNDEITEEQLESITDVKTTYSLVLADYKPEEEVQEEG